MTEKAAKWKNKNINEYELAEWKRVVLNPLFDIYGWLVVAEVLLFVACPPPKGMTRLGYFAEYRIAPLAAAFLIILCMNVFLRKIAQRLKVTAVAVVTMVLLNLLMEVYLYRFQKQPFMIAILLFPIVIAPIYKRKELVYLQAAISFVMLVCMEFVYMSAGQKEQTGNNAERVVSLVLLFYVLIRFELEIMITTNMLDQQSSVDSLTRLLNHEAFYAALEEKMREFAEERVPFSLIILDIDNFKKINDTYGHAFGDEVIRRLSEIIRDNKGLHGICARYGGEEFALILPKEELNGAIIQAERIRREFEKAEFCVEEGEGQHFSISLGVAEYNREYPTASAFFELADKALYEAKGTGKNRVCCNK